MSKVIVLTQYLNIGGLERLVCSLSVGLQQTGNWKPMVCYYDSIPRLPCLKENLIQSGVEVREFRKGKGFSFQLVWFLLKMTKETGATVIHTHDLGPLIYGIGLRILSGFKIRVVHTQHGLAYSRLKARYWFYERVCTLLANRIVCVSSEIQDWYLAMGLKKPKVCLIPNGVQFVDRSRVNRVHKKTLRTELLRGHQESEKWVDYQWILSLARLHVGKGQDHLLDVWEQLPEEERKRSVLLFVGPETSSGYRDILKRRAEELPQSDHIRFIGGSLQPQNWLLASDIFASGSVSEGMPLATLEAMGSGIPCLLSDIQGHRSIVSPQQISAEFVRLFDLKNPELGAQWMEKQFKRIKQDEDQYSAQCWQSSSGLRVEFGINTMMQRYTHLY